MVKGKAVRLVSSDIDGTVLGHPAGAAEFRRIWEAWGEGRPRLAYNTGRLLEDAKRVIREGGLPWPDFFIGGVGTMIEDVAEGRVLDEYGEVLSRDWDRSRVDAVVRAIDAIAPQADEQQHAWKSSWFWRDASEVAIEGLRAALAEEGLKAQVVYSSARDLDVLPVSANKGNALRWLGKRLGIGTDEMVVCGDTGNDSSMFQVAGVRGIAVGNAEPELIAAIEGAWVHRATGECAAGVLEGLKAYGMIDDFCLESPVEPS